MQEEMSCIYRHHTGHISLSFDRTYHQAIVILPVRIGGITPMCFRNGGNASLTPLTWWVLRVSMRGKLNRKRRAMMMMFVTERDLMIGSYDVGSIVDVGGGGGGIVVVTARPGF